MAKTAGSSKGRSREQVRPRLGVVVVDPLAVVRAGVARLIGDLPDLQVLAEVGTADECLAAVRRIRRSRLVVLVGLGLPGERDSLWLIGTLRERHPHATILAVGAGEERAVVRNGKIEAAHIMSVTMSCDHRAVDGALGAELLGAFKKLIENPVMMVV